LALFASLDIGTTGVKAIVCNESGVILSEKRSSAYPVYSDKAGWAEQSPQDWWHGACTCLSQIVKDPKINSNDILAIASDSHTDGCTAVDADGRPLARSIIWMDRRAYDQCPTELESVREIYETTGLACDPYHVAPKIEWLRENRPEVYAKTYKFLNPNDYILLRLTGEFVTDYTLASCTMLFDIRKRVWSDKMTAQFNVSVEKLPKIVSSQSIVGEVTSQAALETGLRKGTQVVAGGGDQEVALVGAGAISPGIVCDITGGAEPIGTTTAETRFDPTRTLELHAHPDPDLWIVESPGITSGENLEWFCKEFGTMKGGDITDPFRVLDQEIETTPPGAYGLVFLPYTMGSITPEWNPHARGAFLGFSLLHKRAHFARSIQEGASYGLRDVCVLMERMGLPVERIVAAGGGAKSAVWCQMKSDVTKKMVLVPKIKSVSAYGSAMLAAVGTGQLSSLKVASEKWVEYDRIFEPSELRGITYDGLYETYTSAYWSLKGIFLKLSELQK